MVPPTIGTVLRRMREEKGWSLRDLEAASGVLVGVIGKIERDDVRSPGILPVARICTALGVRPDDVLVEAGVIPRPPGHQTPVLDPPATRRDIERLHQAIEHLRADLRQAGTD